MNNPYRCVVGTDGSYIEFVTMEQTENGDYRPYRYALNPGESLIEAPPPCDIVKPRWNENLWEETATPEEIEAARAKRLNAN